MARSIASGVALNFGLISTAVSMFSAVDKSTGSGNVLVCDGNGNHDATRIRQPHTCASCGEVPSQQLKKARPVEGGLVILTEEDLSVLNETAVQFKKKASVTAHPAAQVEVLTGVGEKMYYLTPEKGHEATYTTLMALVHAHPELAFMTQWTPRSAVSQFQLRAFNGVLIFQERLRAGQVRETPEVPLDHNEELIGLAEAVLAMSTSVSDYDPQTYADKSAETLAVLLAGREVIATDDAEVAAPAVPVDDLMERLRAAVAKDNAPSKAPVKPKTTRTARTVKQPVSA